MSGVACPTCGSLKSGVTDSRTHAGGIRRRRACKGCGERYTTHEATGYEVMHDLVSVAGLTRRQRFAVRVFVKACRP